MDLEACSELSHCRFLAQCDERNFGVESGLCLRLRVEISSFCPPRAGHHIGQGGHLSELSKFWGRPQVWGRLTHATGKLMTIREGK